MYNLFTVKFKNMNGAILKFISSKIILGVVLNLDTLYSESQIYFAGSMHGGGEDTPLSLLIIEYM